MKNQRKQINVITHRGLEPSNPSFFTESSREAFSSQLVRGFGIEMDFNLTEDNEIILWHNTKEMRSRSAYQILDNQLKNGSYCLLKDIILELTSSKAKYHALHVKHDFQKTQDLDILLEFLSKHENLLSKLIIFDLKLEAARYIRSKFPKALLAASVAHTYDIERFNTAVGQTLLSIDALIEHKDLYNWAWLDEWDLKASNGETKKLYTPEVFTKLRQEKFFIAVISPELHGTSPSLLGGESHESSQAKDILFARIKEIVKLTPDVICTDYPEEVREIL